MIVLNITKIMIAIVHSIYSQSVHALALNAGPMDNDAGRYCIIMYGDQITQNHTEASLEHT